MFQEAVSSSTQVDLKKLSKLNFINQFYLAGGTALALQLGHRRSFDLDFFSDKKFNPKEMEILLDAAGEFFQEKISDYTLTGVFNKTNVTFLYYQYRSLFPYHDFYGVKIADVLDIACSKIDTISSRGRKRDFIDLYFVCKKKISLLDLWKLFEKKYKNTGFNKVHILKSLVYFVDADRDPMPRMLKEINWKEVKKFFENEIKKITKEIYL
ncbi:MAG: nucleotidyl transferase AbiEii/AbiGii toxin family protein [Patescibacteria group bacterium]